MTSTSETGHHRNVAAFEDLITMIIALGATYKPVKAIMKLDALKPHLEVARNILQTVKDSQAAYDIATNNREIALAQLNPLARKIINTLSISEAATQTVNDAQTIGWKISNKRAKEVEVPTEKEIAEGAEPVKTNSVAQQSFDSLVDNLAKLLVLVSKEPKYIPNEDELKVPSIQALLADLQLKNTAVVSAWTDLSNARFNRNTVLYAEGTGVVSVAADIKVYVRTVFGANSHQYKQLTPLQFKKPKTL